MHSKLNGHCHQNSLKDTRESECADSVVKITLNHAFVIHWCVGRVQAMLTAQHEARALRSCVYTNTLRCASYDNSARLSTAQQEQQRQQNADVESKIAALQSQIQANKEADGKRVGRYW